MRYLCTNCHYVYEEILWDTDLWIEAWTKYDDLPNGFSCPACMEWKEHFSAIVEEVNYLDDNDYKSWVEREHMIYYRLEDEVLYVSVWWSNHSFSEDHYIMSIGIYDEYWDLIEERTLNNEDNPETIFESFDFDEFEIRVVCNSHWVWGMKLKF